MLVDMCRDPDKECQELHTLVMCVKEWAEAEGGVPPNNATHTHD